ncbi:MAG: hypothetical protein ACRDTO_00140 [Mycobacterium sp.]
MTGAVVAIAPCFACGNPFAFNPDTVPSCPVDPLTGLPPDLGGDQYRAVRQPICPHCRREANPRRVAAGLTPWPIDEDD